MSNFKKLAVNGICDCCGKETKVVVCSSGLIPMSFKYCEECINDNLEPYDAIVCSAAGVGNFPEDFNEDYVREYRRMLKLYGKSEEQFIQDVKELERRVEEDRYTPVEIPDINKYTVYWLLGDNRGFDDTYATSEEEAAKFIKELHGNRITITDVIEH